MRARDTGYATELVAARIGECRIERIHVKGAGQPELRFSWRLGDKMQGTPLDMPEHELLPLLLEAMKAGVFTADFPRAPHSALYEHKAEFIDAARS